MRKRIPGAATLTFWEAAKFLDLNLYVAYDVVRRGDIPVTKVGKKMYFSKSDLELFNTSRRDDEIK